jgi:hypothetical protein
MCLFGPSAKPYQISNPQASGRSGPTLSLHHPLSPHTNPTSTPARASLPPPPLRLRQTPPADVQGTSRTAPHLAPSQPRRRCSIGRRSLPPPEPRSAVLLEVLIQILSSRVFFFIAWAADLFQSPCISSHRPFRRGTNVLFQFSFQITTPCSF